MKVTDKECSPTPSVEEGQTDKENAPIQSTKSHPCSLQNEIQKDGNEYKNECRLNKTRASVPQIFPQSHNFISKRMNCQSVRRQYWKYNEQYYLKIDTVFGNQS